MAQTYPTSSGLPSTRLVQSSQLTTPAAAFGYYGSGTSSDAPAREIRIKTLAKSLSYNPDRIYEFVRNNMEFEPQFGLHKGDDGLLLDRNGGAFDQAHLMVELLRESNVSARYVLGTVILGSDAGNYLRADDAKQACVLLASSGTPSTVNGASDCASISGAITSVSMLHLWVEAQIGGQWYAFDPALKLHTRRAGADLWGPMQVTPSGAWGAVSTGASSGGAALTGLNPTQLALTMTSYADRLQKNLISAHAADGLVDVVGGWTTVRVSAGRLTALPYQSDVKTRWEKDIPGAYRATLRIRSQGFDQTFDLASIYGHRLQAHMAKYMRYNDTTWSDTKFKVYVRKCEGLAASSKPACETANTYAGLAVSAPSWDHKLTLSIDHPYVSPDNSRSFADETVVKTTEMGLLNEIIVRVGRDSGARFSTYRGQADAYLRHSYVPQGQACQWVDHGNGEGYECRPGVSTAYQSPWSDNPDAPNAPQFAYGEVASLEMASSKDHVANLWGSQISRLFTIAEPLSGDRIVSHHALGIALNPSLGGTALDVDTTLALAPTTSGMQPHQVLPALAAFSANFEAAAITQVSQLNGAGQSDVFARTVSATDLVKASAQAGQALITVYPGDVALAALPAGVDTLARAEIARYVQANFVTTVTPNGGAFFARRQDGSEATWVAYQNVAPNNPGYFNEPSTPAFRKGAIPDPLAYFSPQHVQGSASRASSQIGVVSLPGGALSITETPDLSVGVGEFPDRLTFQRFYSSSGQSSQGLGAGWTHSFDGAATEARDYLAVIDGAHVADSASTIAGFLIALEAGRQGGFEGSVISGLIGSWWSESNFRNVLDVRVGPDSERFIRQADGSWRGGAASQLTKTAAEITRTLADGSVQTFVKRTNTPSLTLDFIIKSWRFPSGAAANYTYGSTLANAPFRLKSISNNRGYAINLTVIESVNPQLCNIDQYMNLCFFGSLNEGHITEVSSVNTGQLVAKAAFVRDGYCDQVTICVQNLIRVTQNGRKVRSYEYLPNAESSFVNGYAATALDFNILTKVKDDGALVASFDWDAAGGLIEPRVSAVIDALNHTTLYRVAGAFHGAMIDPTGGVWRKDFDADGRVKVSVDPLGRVTANTYDGAGRPMRTIMPEGNAQETSYDIRGNVVRNCLLSKARAGQTCSAAAGDIVTQSTYVELPTVVTCSNFKTCNKPLTEVSAKGETTNYSWDPDTGNLIQVKGPADSSGQRSQTDLGYQTFTGVDNASFTLLISKTEKIDTSRSVVTAYAYDTLNRHVLKTATVDPGGLNLCTRFAFDAAGNLTGSTDPRAGACP